MTTARSEHTATAVADGEVLIVGGNDPLGRRLASAEIYDPASGTFSATGAMAVARAQHAAALLNDGRVLITGGTDGLATLASAELFDPATGRFSSTGGMLVARRWHTATTLPTGQILVTGGESSDAGVPVPVSTAELYEPDTASFAATGTLGFATQNFAAAPDPHDRGVRHYAIALLTSFDRCPDETRGDMTIMSPRETLTFAECPRIPQKHLTPESLQK